MITKPLLTTLEEISEEERKVEINPDNYYEKNLIYFSCSQYKGFKECEAREMAKVRREYKQPPSRALLLGNYFHTAFESEEAFEAFKEQNKNELFKKNGVDKLADVIQIDLMIESISQDEYALQFLEGDKEPIFTGNIYGVDFKMKADNVNHFEEFFSDLKSSRGIYDKYWDNEKRQYVSFLEKFDYTLQMAIYQEILLQNTGVKYKPFIIASTKEAVPDKAIFHFEQWRLDDAILEMKDRLARYDLIKQELIEPERCEKCDYCKATKKLSETIEAGDLFI